MARRRGEAWRGVARRHGEAWRGVRGVKGVKGVEAWRERRERRERRCGHPRPGGVKGLARLKGVDPAAKTTPLA